MTADRTFWRDGSVLVACLSSGGAPYIICTPSPVSIPTPAVPAFSLSSTISHTQLPSLPLLYLCLLSVLAAPSSNLHLCLSIFFSFAGRHLHFCFVRAHVFCFARARAPLLSSFPSRVFAGSNIAAMNKHTTFSKYSIYLCWKGTRRIRHIAAFLCARGVERRTKRHIFSICNISISRWRHLAYSHRLALAISRGSVNHHLGSSARL